MRWFHGDPKERKTFEGKHWDRDSKMSSKNESGPGLYCTSSLEEAQTRGAYVYEIKLKEGFTFVPARLVVANLASFARKAPADKLDRFLNDWGTPDLLKAVSNYATQRTQHEALCSLYVDLFQNASSWVQAMVESGFDGVIVPRGTGHKHLVIWDLSAITFELHGVTFGG